MQNGCKLLVYEQMGRLEKVELCRGDWRMDEVLNGYMEMKVNS
jgi:hypothetical protein